MNERYLAAVETIKTAILKSQSRAAQYTNREAILLYYSIGGYVSANSREGTWGTGAIDEISARLREELPGLRGFSSRNIKSMRQFYEAWQPYLQLPQPLELGRKSAATATDSALTEESAVELAIRDYAKPLGVATCRTAEELPGQYQVLAPIIEEAPRLLDVVAFEEGGDQE